MGLAEAMNRIAQIQAQVEVLDQNIQRNEQNRDGLEDVKLRVDGAFERLTDTEQATLKSFARSVYDDRILASQLQRNILIKEAEQLLC